MKRRAFLGFLGGAAAAGPKLASDIAAKVTDAEHAMGVLDSSGYGAATLESARPDPVWAASRVVQLRKLISGEDRDTAKERRQVLLRNAEMIERLRLDSLRSVAPQHKYRMLVEGEAERHHRMQALWWEDELNHLLKLPI